MSLAARSRLAPLSGHGLILAWVLLLGACAAQPPSSAPAGGERAGADGAAVSERRIGKLVLENVPEVPDALAERLRPYQDVRSAALQGWLPDGRMLIGTRFADTTQIHLVAAPGGARRQLTFFSEPVRGAEPSTDPQRPGFLYGRDLGGSESYQLFFFDLASGRSRLLTDGESRNSSPIFDASGKQIAYASTRRNGVDTDVWVGSLDGGDHRAVTGETGYWRPVAFSADGTRLIVYRYLSRSEAYPFVLDLATDTLTPVLADGLAVRVDDVAFAADGEGIYLTSDLGGDFVRLYHLAEPGARPVAVTGDVDWDVEGFALSPDGRYLAWTVNEDARSRLYVRNLDNRAFVALPRLPQGVIYGLEFSPDGAQLGITLNGATSPGDVYAVDLAARTLVRWTRSEVGGLETAAFVEPEHFRYPTFDTPEGVRASAGDPRREIPAYIYRPRIEGSELLRPRPVIISIHGGPESQARPYFSASTQFRVNELGAAVIYPNVRGSTGYGRAFHRLDNGFGREDAVRDIGALLDWIETQPDLDAERVLVTGGSYGGYMALAALTLFPDRFAAGVEAVGISDFVTFLENTQDYRRDLRRQEYGDERDPDMRAFLKSISPLGRVDDLRVPLLVMQGANDPRVPASESRQIVDAVRARGQDVWYLLGLDEGHGFRKRANRDVAAGVTALFMERYLLGDERD
ncbi:MAG TPA: S9 family peptidase [Pseudomonadales bacterium]|nr:S9 family peptidase [Pseudomonadales bacterium]